VPYETFDQSYDLFHDGSVVIVPLPGHTPGSLGVFVNLAPDRRLFLVGDVVHDSRGYLERVDKPWLTARTDSDPPAARWMVARVAQFRAMVPSVQVLPAHARDEWLRFFGEPGRCVDPTGAPH
jgi:glyoxylase-like metal-dependent hydrolase (beta-lactamase superfamily II)